MSIDIQQVYDWKAKRFMGGQDSEDFFSAFMYSLNRVVSLLNSEKVGLGGVSCPTDLETDLEVSSVFLGPVDDMLDVFLQDTGQWEKDSPPERAAKLRGAIGEAHTLAFKEYYDDGEKKARLGNPDDDEDDEENLS